MKKWLIPTCIVAVLLLLCAAALWYMSANTLSFSTGLCLAEDGGSYLVLLNDREPVKMSNRTERDIFSSLTSGDKILLLHDGIQETYPGGTGAYLVIKLSDGELSDVPEDVLESLAELGWHIS